MRGRLIRHLNYPLYLPERARSIWGPLLDRDPPEALAELERLSSLGSSWASATLAYLSLFPAPDGTRNFKRARELCAGPAARRDAYALYVLAYAHYYAGDRLSAAKAMLRASRLGFPPAHLGMSYFAWYGIGTKRRDMKLTMLFLRKGASSGQAAAALLWRCALFRSGAFGALRQLIGYALTPYAFARIVLAAWREPFSEGTFGFEVRSTRPAFSSPFDHLPTAAGS